MGKTLRWSVFVAVALASSTVVAVQNGGTRSVSDVTIVQDLSIPSLWTASGALGDARYLIPNVVLPTTSLIQPVDIKKYIGCGLQTDLRATLATCWAQKPLTLPPYTPPVAQDSVQCISDDPKFIAVVATIKGDSLLTFSLVKSTVLGVPTATCTSINVENSSQHYPKMP